MALPRVKIVNPEEKGWFGTECYIDGNKIENVKSVDFRVAVNEVPHFAFEVYKLSDIDMFGDVQFSFTPETVQQAAVILRNELSKRGELYDCFFASMRSAIDDNFRNGNETCGDALDIGQTDFDEVAKLMLNRLIGLEEK